LYIYAVKCTVHLIILIIVIVVNNINASNTNSMFLASGYA